MPNVNERVQMRMAKLVEADRQGNIRFFNHPIQWTNTKMHP